MSWARPAILGLLVVTVGCTPTDDGSVSKVPPTDTEPVAPRFREIAADVGLDFVHTNGMGGDLYFIEPVGSGCALADLDGDGDLDVVLVQGRALPPAGSAASLDALGEDLGTRIYRNDLRVDADGRARLRFTDVTEASGLRADGYGMGVATGDMDNDGRVDLYLTVFGRNQLWRNVGSDGQIAFVDVTDRAGDGVDDPRWSTSAAFVDIDADGWLDLFVTNYVDFRLATHRPCRSAGGRPDYCGPQAYEGETDRLLWNRGDGTFVDISGPAGLLTDASSGLGVVAADLDQDTRIDLYVANDLRRNHLWRHLGSDADGVPRFENVALERGVAVSMLGRAQASMGVVAADLDDDGDDDLFMTHLSADTNTLYINDGSGSFTDRSAASGLGAPSLDATGFGVASLDIDHDGWLDLIAANGAVKVIEALALAGDPYPLKQANQLFHNRGDGTFVEIRSAAGDAFALLEVSRGIAIGDVDNDGYADVLIANNQGPVRLLQAIPAVTDGAWIGFRALLAGSTRDALGARVGVVRPEGPIRWRRVATDGSYLSASDPRVSIGLGDDPGSVEVRVRWPDGRLESWRDLTTGRYHDLVAGSGTPIPADR